MTDPAPPAEAYAVKYGMGRCIGYSVLPSAGNGSISLMESGMPPERGPEQPPPPPPPPTGPQSPAAPTYGGPVPPGGWETPVAQQPQGLPGGASLAGWWSRVGARLLDGLILLIPVVGLAIVIVAVAAGSDTGAIVTAILGFLAYFIATIFYAPVLMAREGPNNGQTFGKQIVGIRVIRDVGQPFDLGSAFVREIVVIQLLFNFIGSFFFSIPTLLNYLWPLWDDQNRALHDMIVKTHVVSA